MPFAKLIELAPILDVQDVDAALDFYVARLGFQIDFRYEEDPKNYAGVRRDNVPFHMQWQDEEQIKKGRYAIT